MLHDVSHNDRLAAERRSLFASPERRPGPQTISRVERQRTLSSIARALQSAHALTDDATIAAAFRMADRDRGRLGISWPDLIAVEKPARPS